MPSCHTSRGPDSVASVLRRHAAARSDQPFLAFERAPGVIEEVTWAQALCRAERTAGALFRRGVQPGDRVSIRAANCPEFFDVWFGAALLGAALVPSSPLGSIEELAYQFAEAGCRLCVTQSDLRPAAEQAAQGRVDVVSVDEGWVRDDDAPPEVDVAPTDVLSVLYSPGPTGRPRGVLMTHANYLFAGDAVAEHVRLQPSDRVLIVLPLVQGTTQLHAAMPAVVTGASIAVTASFNASRWSEQATVLGATVTKLAAAPVRMVLAQEPSPYDQAHALRLGMFEQRITEAQATTFEDRFDVPLIQVFGTPETVAPPTMNPVFDRRLSTSIGRPRSSARVRIVDDAGRDVRAGESGELVVAGEPGRTLMLGYLDDPAETSAALQDGWLHTGLSVTAGADGFLYVAEGLPPPG